MSASRSAGRSRSRQRQRTGSAVLPTNRSRLPLQVKRSSGPSGWGRLAPAGLAVASGALWGLCFGREPLLLAPWVALAPLILLLGHRRRAILGLLHGLSAWLVSVYWILPTLETYGELPTFAAAGALLLLVAYLALYHALFAGLGGPIWRRGGWLAFVALPSLWVALEWLRTYLLSGFPWNLAAYSWVEVGGALPLAAWIGAYGVSFLLVLANTGAALAVAQRRWEPLALGILIPLLLLAVSGRWAVGWPSRGEPLPVRIVQPNIDNLVRPETEAIVRNYRKVLRLSHQACDEPGALILWPESAAWPYWFEHDPQFRHDVQELAARGCGVLFNSPRSEGQAVFNSAFLVDPEGMSGRYDKRHLVPFGEYVPLAGLFPFIGKVARNAGDFTPARDNRLLSWATEKLGLALCFEVIFPDETARSVLAGASVLVTLTNDAWYGDTSAPWQHLRAARFRASENRRPLLRAAITGVSAAIAADGSVESWLGVGEEGVLAVRVSGRSDLSPYSRAPWLPPLLCSLAAAFAIVRRQERRT